MDLMETEPQYMAFSFPIGKAAVTASVVRGRRLAVGWPSFDSMERALRFFRDTDGERFVVLPGETEPSRVPFAVAELGGQCFTRLEAGTGDGTLVVCANPDRPQPDAFDNITVEFAVERLPEMRERLLEAIVGSSGPSFGFGLPELTHALDDLEKEVR